MKITKRQLKRIIKEEKRKLTEDEDWEPQKRTSRSERTNQAHQIAAILNQIDELMETAYVIARDMESNEDDEGMQNIRARVDSWSDSYSYTTAWQNEGASLNQMPSAWRQILGTCLKDKK